MTTASREAFLELVSSGKRDTALLKVYNSIDQFYFTPSIRNISTETGMSESTIGGRITELLDMGIIKVSGTNFKMSKFKIVTDPLEQLQLSQARAKARVIKALKVLVKNEDFFKEKFITNLIDDAGFFLAVLEHEDDWKKGKISILEDET